MKSILQLSIILLFIFITSNVFATGWVQQKGNSYLQLNYNQCSGNMMFSPSGKTTAYHQVSRSMVSIYGEYGITKKITAVAYLPLLVSNSLTKNPEIDSISYNQKNTNIGDLDLYLKYGIINEGSFVSNIGLLIGIPTGNIDQKEIRPLKTGDGAFNLGIQAEVGYAFSFPVYTAASFGFNKQFNNFSDEIRYGFEIGYAKKFIAILKVNGIHSLENGDAPVNPTGLFSNNLTYMAVGPEIGYIFKDKYGFSFAAYGGSGKNAVAAPAFSLNVFIKLKKDS